ncbi:MAG: manganese catalase family protein [Peptococcaceae bacterium]|nr:manganese catalase family protein [Peptococcaceae bacterium]
MWVYVKHLQFPVRIRRPDLNMAKYMFTQFGGPDGEFSAAWRYLSQRYAMPTGITKAIVTDIGTEELAHLEMIGTMIYNLMRDATVEELEAAGLGTHYSMHGRNMFLQNSAGVPWTAAYYQSHQDVIANLHEDMAAEQKARATYEYLINMTRDEGLIEALSFLREREVVHFQRFGEALDRVQAYNNEHHVFPGLDFSRKQGE